MRLRQIEVFHAVYVGGSISAAARMLHVSQPSVSKVLRHAEDQMGIQLFQLIRGRLVPTDEAHALFREVDEVYERLQSLQQSVRNIKNVGGGHIRLGVVPSLGLAVAPRAIAEFRVEYPDVTFDVQTLHHDALFRSLYERECDLAIAYNPPVHHRMKHKSLGTGELTLLNRKGDEWDSGDLTLGRLDGRDLIGLTASGPIGEIFSAELKRYGVAIREAISVQTFYVAAALVRYGAGITVVDEFTARASQDDRIGFRRFTPSIRFDLACVYLEDRPLSGLAARFIQKFCDILNVEIGAP